MTDAERNPYVGPRPFLETDSAFFFGRARDREALRDSVTTTAITVVYAPSGVGKSSLINAGLIPLLRSDERIDIASAHDWKAGFFPQLSNAARRPISDQPSSIVRLLRQHQEEHNEGDGPRRLVLILDQFEELFRYAHTRDLEAVWLALAELGNSPRPPGHVVIAIREDYLGALDRLIRRVTGLLDDGYRVRPLDEHDLRDAVLEPLVKAGNGASMEDGLADRLLEDLRGRAPRGKGESHIEPGLLQVVCQQLWNRTLQQTERTIRAATYEGAKGAKGIINGYVSGVLDSNLDELHRDMFLAASRYLVTPTGGKIALSPETLAQWIRERDFTPSSLRRARSAGVALALDAKDGPLNWTTGVQELRVMLDRLCSPEARILRRVALDDGAEYQLAHDLLGGIILSWREETYGDQLKAETDTVVGVVRGAAISSVLVGSGTLVSTFLLLVMLALVFEQSSWVRHWGINATVLTGGVVASVLCARLNFRARQALSPPGDLAARAGTKSDFYSASTGALLRRAVFHVVSLLLFLLLVALVIAALGTGTYFLGVALDGMRARRAEVLLVMGSALAIAVGITWASSVSHRAVRRLLSSGDGGGDPTRAPWLPSPPVVWLWALLTWACMTVALWQLGALMFSPDGLDEILALVITAIASVASAAIVRAMWRKSRQRAQAAAARRIVRQSATQREDAARPPRR